MRITFDGAYVLMNKSRSAGKPVVAKIQSG